MNLSAFEDILAQLLERDPQVQAVRTYADAGYGLFGIQLKVDGQVVWVRLTRGSPPLGGTGNPVIHEGPEPPATQSLDEALARQVEALLSRALVTGAVPELAWVMSFHDRAQERERAKPTPGGTAAGLVARFDDGTELYLSLGQ